MKEIPFEVYDNFVNFCESLHPDEQKKRYEESIKGKKEVFLVRIGWWKFLKEVKDDDFSTVWKPDQAYRFETWEDAQEFPENFRKKLPYLNVEPIREYI